jgi:hypothetical protein
MTTVTLMRNAQGQLVGATAADERKYNGWRRKVRDFQPGEYLRFSWDDPRSPKHFGKFMAKMRLLVEQSEAFPDEEAARKYLTVAAGYVTFEPGPDSTPNAIPMSLAYDQLDEAEFTELHRRIDDVLWLPETLAMLWPHLTEKAQHSSMEGFFYQVEHSREQQL